ncbi:MAG: SDR family oxidoreductase [Chlamydiae bacterium]|nr:SDR family oxidoreductase [Chlamydiota bacterium]
MPSIFKKFSRISKRADFKAGSKKIVVAGGAGFLGSHLVEKLLLRGNSVICIDNLTTGVKKNLLPFLSNSSFQFIQSDICDELEIQADEIYNFACPASPKAYQLDPIQTLRTNVIGTMNLLELARKTKAKFFQASTSEIYGDPEIHPQHEEYWGYVNPIGPRSCYDEGKRCSETFCYEYWSKNKMNIKIGRIFNTYGPRMQVDDGRVVSNFIIQALQNKPLTLYGDGNQTRSFCYVDDLIDAILLFMERPSDIVGPLNLGSTAEISVENLAKIILDLTGSKSSLTYLNLPKDDPKKRRPDISLAKNLLNWSPKIHLEEGLQNTISFFRALI